MITVSVRFIVILLFRGRFRIKHNRFNIARTFSFGDKRYIGGVAYVSLYHFSHQRIMYKLTRYSNISSTGLSYPHLHRFGSVNLRFLNSKNKARSYSHRFPAKEGRQTCIIVQQQGIPLHNLRSPGTCLFSRIIVVQLHKDQLI